MRRRRFSAPPWMWGSVMWHGCGHGRRPHEYSEEDIEILEELQRDLEEAAADVAERIRRIKERHSETESV